MPLQINEGNHDEKYPPVYTWTVLKSDDGTACHPLGSGPPSGGAVTPCLSSFFSAPKTRRTDGSERQYQSQRFSPVKMFVPVSPGGSLRTLVTSTEMVVPIGMFSS